MLFKIKRIEWCNFQVVGAQVDATTSKNAQIKFWDITPKHKSTVGEKTVHVFSTFELNRLYLNE